MHNAADNHLNRHSLLRPRLRDYATGLYLQMYFWGLDVRHPGGNLLVRHGFERLAKQGPHGASRYRLSWRDGVIELHGFVAGWYRASGESLIFVRQRRAMQLCGERVPVNPHRLERADIRPVRGPEDMRQLVERMRDFTTWLLGYEQWVAAECGPAWRETNHAEYRLLPKAHHWLPPAQSREWFRQFQTNPCAVPRARKMAWVSVSPSS